MSGQLLLTWYVVEFSTHKDSSDNIGSIVAEYVEASVDEAFNRLTDHTDKDTVITSRSRLLEVRDLLIAAKTGGSRSLRLGIAINRLEAIIATAEEEEDLYDDVL